MWYHEHIGGGRCPVVDTWWQTETGAIMISPAARAPPPEARLGHLPAARHRRRGGRRRRASRSSEGGGYLTLTRPWPSMLRGIYGDPERYRQTYWSRFAGRYFAGDGAKLDDDGYLWLLGRVDDVMNVSGHRISTTEVESAAGRPPDGGRGGRGRRQGRHHRAGHHRLRHPARAASTPSDGARRGAAPARGHQASAPSPGPRRSSSPTTCRRPAAARSCAGCSATWPRAATSATPRRWPTRPWSRRSARRAAAAPQEDVTRPPTVGRRPTTGAGATGAVDPGRRRGVRHGRRAVRRRRPPALPRRPGPAGLEGASSTPCGDDPLIEEVARLIELLDRDLALVLLTARPVRDPAADLAWLERYGLRWDLLVMRARRRLRAVAGVQARRTVRELRGRRVRPAAGLRGRPPQRRHVPRRGRPLRLHPLGYYELTTPAGTSRSAPVRSARGR